MLSSKERATLRAAANDIETIFQIGKGGISENLIHQTEDALRARELIKLRVLETALLSAKDAAGELARACGAEVVQCIGTKRILYRENAEKGDRRLLLNLK